MILAFALPLKTVSPMNGAWGLTKGAMFAKAKKRKVHRETAKLALEAEMRRRGLMPRDLLPCVVTLTRASAGRLDRFDALPGAMKSIVDGLADALGVNDGAELVEWRAKQKKCKPGLYGVLVVLEPLPQTWSKKHRRSA